MQERIKSIRDLISEGRTKEALVQLKEIVSEDTSKIEDVIGLQSRQNRLDKSDINGTIPNEEKNTEQNKINNSVLQIVRIIENELGIKSEAAQNAASKFVDVLRKSREFTFLLMGKTGVGKSSTINNLMGTVIAEVGDYIPTTMEVKEYRLPIEGFNFHVIDTPGLCDDLPKKGNDEKYIKEIKAKVKQIDTLLYVTNLNDTRVRIDERQGIETITKAFSEKIWENSVIIFTFSNSVQNSKFSEALKIRSGLIRQTIEDSGVSTDITNKIPSVAIDNINELNPDGKYWLGELYTCVAERVSNEGFHIFFMSTLNRVDVVNTNTNDSNNNNYQPVTTYIEPVTPINPVFNFNPRIRLDKVQEKRVYTTAKEKGFFEKAGEFVGKVAKSIGNGLKKLGKWLFG